MLGAHVGQLVSPASSTRCVVPRFHFRFRGLNLGLAGPVCGPSGSVGPSVSAPCPPSRGGTRHVARLFTSIGREVAVALLKNHTHHTSIAPRRTRDCGHARPTPRTPDDARGAVAYTMVKARNTSSRRPLSWQRPPLGSGLCSRCQYSKSAGVSLAYDTLITTAVPSP